MSAPSDVVKSAAVMVAVQAACSIGEAVAVMQQASDDADVTLEELAGEVLNGQVAFGRAGDERNPS
jgi:hypothetical protein